MATHKLTRIFLLYLLFAGSAQAQTFGIHAASIHEKQGMNNTNPGAYVRFENGATFGTYFNSIRKQSNYIAWSFETEQWHRLSAAITVGAVTGYQAKLSALIVPSIAYHSNAATVRIGIVPRPPVHGGSAALHLMVERHF